MVLFCDAVVLGGDDLMGLFYRGTQYHGYSHTVAVLAVGMLISALGIPASNGLAVIERADVIFKVGVVAVLVLVVLAPCLALWWGVTGAAFGVLASYAVGSVGRWIAFSSLLWRGGKGLQQMAQARQQDEVNDHETAHVHHHELG
jgi:O-antigen/teichoic acid export membrane protein